jgi:hypothetical protein
MGQKRAECRFCLAKDTYQNLISPCDCKGSCKYVHEKCLVLWYNQRPDRGLHCGICNQELAREVSQPLEDLTFADTVFDNYKIFQSMSMLLILHGMYFSFFLTFFLYLRLYPIQTYGIYQVIVHSWYGYGFLTLVQNVKNKQKYFKLWVSWNTLALATLQLYCVIFFLVNPFLSGLSLNVCLMLYYMTHYEILQQLNKHSSFVFLSKKTPRRRRLNQ